MNSTTNTIDVSETPAAQLRRAAKTATFATSAHDAEVSFLAVLLGFPQFVDHALQRGVTRDLFHSEGNQRVFDAMVKLAADAVKDDGTLDFSPVALAGILEARDCELAEDFRQIGRSGAINADPNITARAALNVLTDRARRRAAITQAMNLQLALLDDERDTTQLLASACDDLATLQTSSSRNNQQMRNIGDIELPERDPGGIKFTHLPYVSHMLDGFRPGTLSVIAARTGVGKSSLLQSMALDAAIGQSIPTLYLDTEMTHEQFLCRVIAAQTGFSVAQIRNRAEHPDVAEAVRSALAAIRTRPLAYCSIAGQSVEFALSHIRRFQRYHPNQQILVLYDYIKLPSMSDNAKETQVLGSITNALKEEAVKGGFAIVAGAQVNRAGLKMTHDDHVREGEGIIYGSDKIAHLCDALMVLRNLGEDELTRVTARFGKQNDDAEPANRAIFNAVLYGSKVREGSAFPQGIPLFHQRGRYTFSELVIQRDDAGLPVFENGRPRTSDVFGYFRSPDFRRQGKKLGGFGTLPQQMIIPNAA